MMLKLGCLGGWLALLEHTRYTISIMAPQKLEARVKSRVSSRLLSWSRCVVLISERRDRASYLIKLQPMQCGGAHNAIVQGESR